MGQIKKIAIEEHFNAVGFEDYSKSFVALIDNANAQELQKKLTDFDELRLAEMDKVGLDYVILSQTGPGVQAEKMWLRLFVALKKITTFWLSAFSAILHALA